MRLARLLTLIVCLCACADDDVATPRADAGTRDAAPACPDIESYCAAHGSTQSVLPTLEAPCIRHLDLAASCAADPYDNVSVASCSGFAAVTLGLVDTGFTYYYGATSSELIAIESYNANNKERRCVAGHVPEGGSTCPGGRHTCEEDAGS